jgi:peptide deformylase
MATDAEKVKMYREKAKDTTVPQEVRNMCLSFPEVFIPVTRPAHVRIRAQDAEGRSFEVEGEGLGARALLHEIDHLRGVVMVDHVSFLQRQRALKKHDKVQAAEAASRRRAATRA